MKLIAALPLIALLVPVASCSQLKQLGDVLAPYTPKLSFQKLELNRIDFSSIDVDFKFNVANQGTLTTHTGAGLTAAVKSWYAAGGWVNNGWVLRRDGAGDTCGKSNMFASRSHADPNLRPRLEITWGP